MGEIRKLYQNSSNVETNIRPESDAVYPITSDSAVYHSQGWGTKGTDQTVDSILRSLNEGYQYVGVATPNTSPNVFDHKVFYIAGKSGLYPYFGGINVSGLTILRNNGNSWIADSVGITGGGSVDPATFVGYIGTTLVQDTAQEQDLYGIGDIHMGSQKRIYFGSDPNVYMEYNSNGFHFSKGLYSDGQVAGGGIITNSSGGGGGGDSVSITNIDDVNHLADLTVNEQTVRICLNGYAAGGGGGVVTETDPIFTASPAYGISASDIESWNDKVSNVQADWAQNNQNAESYIKNKPSIPPAVTEATVSGWGFTKNIGTITEIQMNGQSIGTSGVINLGTVVTAERDPVFVGSPAYTISAGMIRSWNNKQEPLTEGEDYYSPTQVLNRINSSIDTFSGNLAEVAFSGDYNDLENLPTIPVVPTNVSAFTNDAGYLTQHQDLSNYLTKTEAGSIYQSKLNLNSVLDIRAIELRDQSEALVVPAWDAILSGSGENLEDALSDPNHISTDSTHLWLTQNYIDTWNAKQNAMTAGTDYLTPSQIAAAYLPLTGGTLSRTDQDVLTLRNTNANYVRFRMLDSTGAKTLNAWEWESFWGGSFSVNNANGTLAGKLGIFPDGKPYYGYLAQDGVNIGTYELLHEGNWRDLAHLDLKSFAQLGGSENLNNAFHPAEGEYRGFFRYYAYVGRDGSTGTAGVNGFPTSSNANALLSIGTYDDGTNLGVYQIGLSANGSIYFRDNSSDLLPFTNGNWKRLLWEDHNGDASVGRHLTLPKAGRLRLDAGGDAYITRGFGTDYGLYIYAGHDSDGTSKVHTHVFTDALCPNATADQSNLGASDFVWNNLYAKRWYPDPTNAPNAFIDWDATNQAFRINGPVYSTEQITAGGIYSND